jgi:hypothetical protein
MILCVYMHLAAHGRIAVKHITFICIHAHSSFIYVHFVAASQHLLTAPKLLAYISFDSTAMGTTVFDLSD